MKKWNDKFYHDWDNHDQLMFHVAINRLPENVRKYGDCRFMADAVEKIQEEDEDFYSPVLGTRRPSTRAERRKATRRAKNRRQDLAKYADDFIMPNSGKVKNTGSRSYEKGDKVYRRDKKIPVESTVSPFNPLDGDFLDFNPDTIDSYETEKEDGRIWEEADKIATYEDYLWEGFEADLERDSALLEENIKNWEWEEPSPVGIVEPEEKAQTDSLKNQVENLKNEITRLNGFLQEFNLNKLYEQFLLDKGHEFF